MKVVNPSQLISSSDLATALVLVLAPAKMLVARAALALAISINNLELLLIWSHRMTVYAPSCEVMFARMP